MYIKMVNSIDLQVHDSAQEGVIIVDSNFNILDASSTLLKSLDLERQDAIGKKCFMVACCGSTDKDCPIKKVSKSGESSKKLHTYKDKNGNEICMEITVHQLLEDENIERFVHIERDITDRRQVEMEIGNYLSMLRSKEVKESTERARVEMEVKMYIGMLKKKIETGA